MLMEKKARSITILNRTFEKADTLAGEMNRLFGREIMTAMPLGDYEMLKKDSYLAIQTTSVGMHPQVDAAAIEDREFYKKIHTGVDIIYTPKETRFMKLVREANGQAVNGLDMLIYQGIIAFELWNPKIQISKEITDKVRQMMEEKLKG